MPRDASSLALITVRHSGGLWAAYVSRSQPIDLYSFYSYAKRLLMFHARRLGT